MIPGMKVILAGQLFHPASPVPADHSSGFGTDGGHLDDGKVAALGVVEHGEAAGRDVGGRHRDLTSQLGAAGGDGVGVVNGEVDHPMVR